MKITDVNVTHKNKDGEIVDEAILQTDYLPYVDDFVARKIKYAWHLDDGDSVEIHFVK